MTKKQETEMKKRKQEIEENLKKEFGSSPIRKISTSSGERVRKTSAVSVYQEHNRDHQKYINNKVG